MNIGLGESCQFALSSVAISSSSFSIITFCEGLTTLLRTLFSLEAKLEKQKKLYFCHLKLSLLHFIAYVFDS